MVKASIIREPREEAGQGQFYSVNERERECVQKAAPLDQ